MNDFNNNSHDVLKEKATQFLESILERFDDLMQRLMYNIKVKIRENHSVKKEKTIVKERKTYLGPLLNHQEIISSTDYLEKSKSRNKPKLKPIIDSNTYLTLQKEKFFRINDDIIKNKTILDVRDNKESIRDNAMNQDIYKKNYSTINNSTHKRFRNSSEITSNTSNFKQFKRKITLPWTFYNQIEPKTKTILINNNTTLIKIKKSKSNKRINFRSWSKDFMVPYDCYTTNKLSEKQTIFTIKHDQEDLKANDGQHIINTKVIELAKNKLNSKNSIFKNSNKINHYIYNSINENIKKNRNNIV